MKRSKEEFMSKYNKYLTFDKDIPFDIQFNKKTIFIKPIKVIDIYEYLSCIDILRFEKDEYIPLRLNYYLDYIIYMIEHDKNGEYNNKTEDGYDNPRRFAEEKFKFLLSKSFGISENTIYFLKESEIKNKILCNYKTGYTKIKSNNDIYEKTLRIVEKNPKNNEIDIKYFNYLFSREDIDSFYYGDKDFKVGDFINPCSNYLTNEWYEITAKEIDYIIRIINYINDYDYDDTYLHPVIREDIERYKRINSSSKNKTTIERLIMDVERNYQQYTYKDIENMSIRRFYSKISFNQDYINWCHLDQGLYSGMIEVKNKNAIKHYQCERGTYMENNMVDSESFANKINQ